MKKIHQSFTDVHLEQKYQEQRNQKLQKPIFYSFIVVQTIMNIISLITQLINFYDEIPITSIYGFVAIIVQIIIVFKYQQYIKYALTLFNLFLPFYQLSLDENYVSSQEIFSYGCNFTIISAVIAFISDFHLSLLQIFFNMLTRQIITAIYSQRLDYINIFLNIAAAIFLSITIYKFDITSRSQFLMNEKESLFLQQSQNFILKPHFLIQLVDRFINITYMYKCQEYDYNQLYYCFGCFGRHFLRNSVVKNSQYSLEQILLQKDQTNLQRSYQIKYGRINLQIKVTQYGYHDRFVIIIEKGLIDKIQDYRISFKVLKTFQDYFHQINSPFNYHRMIKFGMACILLLNSLKIKNINLTKVFSKLIREFNFDNKIHLRMFRDNACKKVKSDISFITFSNQMRIFLIQILIISQLLVQKEEIINLILHEHEDYVNLKISLRKSKEFEEFFYQNFFIKSTSEFILFESLDVNLELKFRKQIPFYNKVKQQFML